jgi:DNA-directed RNA polymerase subunit RPC12/RpoP
LTRQIKREQEGTEEEWYRLKCPNCSYKGIYFRTNKKLHYKCKKCGREFNYPEKQTLECFAELLSWDLYIIYRNALENYINPMIRHGYFIHEDKNCFTFIGNGKGNKQIKKGKIDKEEKTQLQKDIEKHE